MQDFQEGGPTYVAKMCSFSLLLRVITLIHGLSCDLVHFICTCLAASCVSPSGSVSIFDKFYLCSKGGRERLQRF